MGCDIHAYAEVRRDGKWEAAGKVFPNRLAYADWIDEDLVTEDAWQYRNYRIFAELNGVRNDEGATPITPPEQQCFPDDASDGTKALYERWTADAHSHGWLTLEQILAHNWKPIVHPELKHAWVSMLVILRGLGEPRDVRLVFWFDC